MFKANVFIHIQCNILKLPSLFDAWLFWTFHTKSHNMKALVILSHSWSQFLPLIVYMEKKTLVGLYAAFWGIFLRKKLLSDYPCKSHDHDPQWAVLVMAKQGCERIYHCAKQEHPGWFGTGKTIRKLISMTENRL